MWTPVLLLPPAKAKSETNVVGGYWYMEVRESASCSPNVWFLCVLPLSCLKMISLWLSR